MRQLQPVSHTDMRNKGISFPLHREFSFVVVEILKTAIIGDDCQDNARRFEETRDQHHPPSRGETRRTNGAAPGIELGPVCGFAREGERFKKEKEIDRERESGRQNNVTDRQFYRAGTGENICFAAREKYEISRLHTSRRNLTPTLQIRAHGIQLNCELSQFRVLNIDNH